tara:strand:- start:427 stop:618 length:192 start_codon:yes stop_codon:yes gene_type:complete
MELKKVIDDWVSDKLSDPKVRKEVIDKWNANVNIPILNESTEEKIFAAIYDSAVDVLEKVLKK